MIRDQIILKSSLPKGDSYTNKTPKPVKQVEKYLMKNKNIKPISRPHSGAIVLVQFAVKKDLAHV
jgi:hypothetical protein